MEAEKRRYVGIDLGKREYTLVIIGKNNKMSIHQGKTSCQGRAALYGLLEQSDKVAVAATGWLRSAGIERGETAVYLGCADKDGQGRRHETGTPDSRTA